MRFINKITLFTCIILILSPGLSYAGKLDDFEKDTEKKKNKSSKEKSVCDEIAAVIIGAVAGAIAYGVVEGIKDGDGKDSGSKNDTKKDLDPKKENPETISKPTRQSGDPMLTYARIDAAYQHISSRLEAQDYLAEFGYRGLAVSGRFTHYMESKPDDTMDAVEAFLLLRRPIGEKVEVQLGAGIMSISGDKTHSGAALTLPVKIRPWKYLGFEIRPAWAEINENFMQDYDVSIFIGSRYISAKAGYRWLLSPNETLDGPYAGISLYY
jgi:hypothetical protein